MHPQSRSNILKRLGPPIQTVRFSPPIRLKELNWNTDDTNYNEWVGNHRRRFLVVDYYEKGNDGLSHVVRVNPEITYMERFTKLGRIVPFGYAGDTMAVSSATLGLGEVIAIPAAVVYKSTGENIRNTFWIWYDSNDTPVAYEWEFTAPGEKESSPATR